MRTLILLLALVSSRLPSQALAPRFMYIYRDSLKRGVDSAYRVIENDAAQICADLRCPNPYIGLESLNGPHEAWWLNTFATEADTARVAKAYAADRVLAAALGAVSQRKASLIGSPVQGFAVYRRDLSPGPWPVAGARFIVVNVTSDHRAAEGPTWMMRDSTLYVLRPVRTFREAEALRRRTKARVFAIRPNWSMPAAEWVSADPGFWRGAPIPNRRRQRACKGSSSLVYRDSVTFFLDAPEGWTLDCEAGRNDGPLTVLYRVGESWRSGTAVMYASMLSLEPGADTAVARRIDAEVREWKQRAGDAVVTREPAIRTAAGVIVPVRRFVSKAHGLHEIVAYVPRGRDMPILAMTARSAQAFDRALPAFRALVRSYAVGLTARAP